MPAALVPFLCPHVHCGLPSYPRFPFVFHSTGARVRSPLLTRPAVSEAPPGLIVKDGCLSTDQVLLHISNCTSMFTTWVHPKRDPIVYHIQWCEHCLRKLWFLHTHWQLAFPGNCNTAVNTHIARTMCKEIALKCASSAPAL